MQAQKLWDAGHVPPLHAGSPGASPGGLWCWLTELTELWVWSLLVVVTAPSACSVQWQYPGAPAKDKCSFVCQTETGQEMTSTGGCKHDGQGEQTPSLPGRKIRRVKGER